MSNYETTSDVKSLTGVDKSDFAEKADVASLKSKVEKIDVDKLETVPTDLSKLRNVVEKDVVKKNEYDKLVKKVDAIDLKKQNFQKGLKMLIKRYLIPVNLLWLKTSID